MNERELRDELRNHPIAVDGAPDATLWAKGRQLKRRRTRTRLAAAAAAAAVIALGGYALASGLPDNDAAPLPADAPSTQMKPGLDLSKTRWVTLRPGGLFNSAGAALWRDTDESAGASVARDGMGGLVLLDDGGLSWLRSGTSEPVHVNSDAVVGTLIGVSTDGFVILDDGAGPTFLPLDPANTGSPEHQVSPVTRNSDYAEIWTASNGWSVSLVNPNLSATAAGPGQDASTEGAPPPGDVIPGRLTVLDDGGVIVADVIVGTTDEPWVRVHDFDGRTLIVSRGNVVDHIPEETFLVIDLGCSSCTETFTAQGTSAALSGPDSTWSGPADFTELSLR